MPLLTRTTRYTSTTNIATVLGVPASALALLSGETQGFAIDATTEGGSLAIIDTGTPANNKSDVLLSAGNLTNAGISAKVVTWNDGTLHTIAAGQIAQAYDGNRFGVLIEPDAINLMLQSQDFATTWTTFQGSISTDATTAPDGTLTADKITEDSSNATHSTIQSANVASGSTYTFSVYLKAAERTWAEIQGSATGYTVQCKGYFNLASGSPGSTVGAGVTSSMENIGNGWYRCAIHGLVCDITVANNHIVNIATGDLVDTYLGDGASGLYVWGAQLELGDVASSYIATTSGTVLRDADEISCATSTYPHSDATGTFIAWFKRREIDGATNDRILQISDGTDQERVVFRVVTGAAPDAVGVDVVNGGVTQVNAATTNTGAMTLSGNKAAIAYTLNNTGLVVDGAAELTDVACTMPTCTMFQLGHAVPEITVRELNGYIFTMVYVPRRMTETEMQTRTG